jgi:glycosyltransferase involved in cell wall biosynthesis
MSTRSVLLIAFEMPPARSSGVQRPYRFAQYLLELGWDPYIITASPDVYQHYDYDFDVPDDLKSRIYRAPAVDIHKSLSIKGKTPDFLSLPDRYWPWYFSATRLGAKLIREKGIELLWSTYPILTSHLVGRKLSLKFDLPWFADFRDPLQCHYDINYDHYNFILRHLEKKVVTQASRVITTCEQATGLYRNIYKELPPEKFTVIQNGFVPTEFQKSEPQNKFTLLYSGVLYSVGRDTKPLFEALSNLKKSNRINSENFILRFRGAPGAKEQLQSLLEKLNIVDVVEFTPAISFSDAQSEMVNASANLLIQDEIFNFQVPGKLYDYIQANRPIVAICPPDSATASVCRTIPSCEQVWQLEEIEQILCNLVSTESYVQMSENQINQFSRRQRTIELIQLCQKFLKQQA